MRKLNTYSAHCLTLLNVAQLEVLKDRIEVELDASTKQHTIVQLLALNTLVENQIVYTQELDTMEDQTVSFC